jgi:hypothetical protein
LTGSITAASRTSEIPDNQGLVLSTPTKTEQQEMNTNDCFTDPKAEKHDMYTAQLGASWVTPVHPDDMEEYVHMVTTAVQKSLEGCDYGDVIPSVRLVLKRVAINRQPLSHTHCDKCNVPLTPPTWHYCGATRTGVFCSPECADAVFTDGGA